MIDAREMDTTPADGFWQLPKGWEWIPLEDLCSEIAGGGTPSRNRTEYFGGNIIWITPSDLNTNDPIQQIVESQTTLTQAGLDNSSARILPVGTVLFSSRATIGKIGLAQVPLCTNQGFVNFVCKADSLNNHYLAWCLHLLTEEIKKLAGSTTYQEVSRSSLRHVFIPIPFPGNRIRSLDIQYRIVERIESLIIDLREVRNTLESMRQDTDQVMNSVLKEVFEDLFNSTSGWSEQSVEDLCYDPQYGYTQSATLEPIGPKFLRITDIQNGHVDWNSVPYCQIPEGRIPTYLLQRGDILFARSGATTGKTFLVEECPTAVFASYLIRLRVKESVLPELLAWFFKSRVYWNQVQLGGSAQPNMNAQLLKKVKVRYPQSFQLQQQIVNYLDSIQEGVDELQSMMEEDEEILETLEQSILSQAFRGEL